MDENKGSDVCLLLCKNGVGKFDVFKVSEPPQAAVSCHTFLIKLKKIIYYESYAPGNFAGRKKRKISSTSIKSFTEARLVFRVLCRLPWVLFWPFLNITVWPPSVIYYKHLVLDPQVRSSMSSLMFFVSNKL